MHEFMLQFPTGDGQLPKQSSIYQYMLPRMHPFCLVDALSVKFRRWFSDGDALALAIRARDVLNRIYTMVPPCVLFCLISTWCNAWCTKRRFQGKGPCYVCVDCQGSSRFCLTPVKALF
eukprot:4405104-Karenia_brevis.AAC.1